MLPGYNIGGDISNTRGVGVIMLQTMEVVCDDDSDGSDERLLTPQDDSLEHVPL